VATEIGIIKTLIGTAVATAADGSQRNLQAGDRVFQDEIITTGAAGAVEVEFTDGSVMTLGRSSQIVLDTETFNPLDVAQAPIDAESEVDALQQALLEGADPTQVGEATAAGAGAGGSGNEGSDFVTVNYLAPEVTPTSGFDTTGISIEFPELEEEVPGVEQDPDDVPTTGLTSITVDEDDLGGGEGNDQSNPVSYDVYTAFHDDTGLYLYDFYDQGNKDNAPGDDNAGAAAPTTVTGLLNVSFGADGAGDITFNNAGQPGLTSGGEPLNYWVSDDGHTLVAYVEHNYGDDYGEGDVIFVAQITDPATGAYEFTLTGNLDHPDATTEDNLLVDLAYTISDSDGDTAQGALTVDVDDDSPVIDSVEIYGEDSLGVVEASGAQGEAFASFGSYINIHPGADFSYNKEESSPYNIEHTLELTGDGTTTLVTTDGNHPISLVVSADGQTVTGQYEDGGTQTAFTVSLSNGSIRLVSNVALEHDNTQGGTEDNSLDINGLVNLAATATWIDSDGDTDVESNSTPLNIAFIDTDPTLQFTAAATVEDLSVTEASLADGQDSVTITAPTYTASAVDGYTDVVSYALALVDGAASGLMTTDGNHAITLVVSGDGQTVEGQYNGSNVAFTVSIVGGEVVLTSNVALEHANGPQNTEDNTLDINGLLNLVSTVTVTDGDNDAIVGEHNSRTALNLEFADTDPTLTVNDDMTFSAALSVVEASSTDGAQIIQISGPTHTESAVDGETTTVSYALVADFNVEIPGLTTSDAAGGEYPIFLYPQPGGGIVGLYHDGAGVSHTAFDITLSGSEVRLVSFVALEHDNTPQGAGEDNSLDLGTLVSVAATVTTTDGDGDVVADSTTAATPLSITFTDTDPTVTVTAAATVGDLSVVEAAGEGEGNQASVAITAPTYTASAVDGYSSAAVTYALALDDGAASGLVTTVDNHAITLVVSPDGQTVEGQYNGSNVAFTVSIVGGEVVLTSNVAVEHANEVQADDADDDTLDINGLVNLVSTVTVTDGDNDAVVGSTKTETALNLEFTDTDPVLIVTAPATISGLSVTEASLVGGQDSVAITAPTYTASAVDGYTDVVSYALALIAGADSGLMTTEGNHAITLVVSPDGQTVEGQYDGTNVAFTVSVSGSNVVLTSNVALEHDNTPQGAGEDNTVDITKLINLVSTVTVTDGDNDAIVEQENLTTALHIDFVDTDPTLTVNDDITFSDALSVVEASGEDGDQTVTISGPTYTASAVDGYDTTVSYALVATEGEVAGLVTTDGNYAISLVQVDANTVNGVYNDGAEQVAFTIDLSGNSVTLVSNVALEHDNTQDGSEDNSLDLGSLVSVAATVTTTDGDEDVVSDSTTAASPLSLTISDTDPSLSVNNDITFSDALSVVEASGAENSDTVTISGPTYTPSAVDGETTTVSYALVATAGAVAGLTTSDAAGGEYAISLVQVDANTVNGVYNDGAEQVAFTISLSGSDVTLTSFVALEHENIQDGEDDTLDLASLVSVAATVTTTDGDGDVVADSTTAATPLSLTISDTDPVSITPEDIHRIDLATAPDVVADLNFVSGADGVETVRFINIVDGAPAMDEAGNHLSFEGGLLYLHYGNNGTDLTRVEATTSPTLGQGTVAYFIDIDPSTGTYSLHSEGVIENGTTIAATNLSSVGGGNVELKAISNIGGTEQDVILTTASGDTVNSNQHTIGISTGNSFVSPEAIRFDFANGSVNGAGDYVYDGTHNVTTAYRQAVHLTAGASSASITVAAILADSDNVFFGDTAGETGVAITGVKVYSGTVVQVDAGTATDQTANVTITYNADGTISITGLQDGWVYEVTTDSDFSALQLDADSGVFKLGLFSYGVASDGLPVELSYDVEGVDGDGDTVTGSIDATLYPAGATVNGDELGNILDGTDGIDYILGNDGSDTLTGLGGNDILVGGDDSDTFVFSMASNTDDDVIVDFEIGTDSLSFTDVIDTGTAGLDLNDVVSSVSDGGAGSDVTVNLTNGGSVILSGIGTGSTTDASALESLIGAANIDLTS